MTRRRLPEKSQREKEEKMEIRGEKIGGSKPWIARITGTDPKYGLRREFERGCVDYSGSNKPGTRGIYTNWILAQPGIYEYSLPSSWSNTDKGFIELLPDGSTQKLTQIEVLRKFSAAEKEAGSEQGAIAG